MKRIKGILIILFCVILLIPVPTWYKDGGTVKYTAITYSETTFNGYRLSSSSHISINN